MRAGILMLTVFVTFGGSACRHTNGRSAGAGAQNLATLSFADTAKKPDFDTQIKPIFQARCQPCHFPGGKVYDKLPFDKPETITRLSEKLFTRIKDEKEQRLIRKFLSQP